MPYGNDPIYAPPGHVNAYGDAPLGATPAQPAVAKDIGDAIIAGLESSSGGLAVRGKMPDEQLGPDAPWYMRAAYGVGGLAGDVPAIAVGSYLGARTAGPAGAMAGAFAVPMAIREALTTAYTHNYATTWDEVKNVAWAALKGGAKGAAIGALTQGAGSLVGPLAAKALEGTAPVAAQAGTQTAKFVAELGTMTTAGDAFQGRIPTMQDFMDNAILLGGVKTITGVTSNMVRNYAETGKTPAQQVQDAMNDPKLREQILTGKPGGDIPDAYKQLGIDERIQAALAAKQPQLMKQMLDTAKDPNTPSSEPPVRYEYVTDSETAQGVIQAAAKAYADQVQQQTRGTVPTAASFAAGTKLVDSGLVKPRTVGAPENDATIVARAVLTKGAAERAQRIADELSMKDPADISTADQLRLYGAMEQVGLFYSELAGSGAELGRALRMLREVKRDPSQLGDAEAMLKAYSKRGNINNVAELARSLRDPAQMADFADKFRVATGMEKLTEVWKASILSGFRTPEANILGNVGRLAAESVSQPVGATIEAAKRFAAGDTMPASVFRAKALAPLIGTKLAVQDGMRLITEIHQLYRNAAETGNLKSIEDAKALMRKAWDKEEAHLDKYEVFQQATSGITGKLTKSVFDVMLIGDIPFRTIGERAKAYELAVERAVNEKFTPGTREFDAAVKRYADEPTAGLAQESANEVMSTIRQSGAEYVFAEPLGPRMNKISQAIQGSLAEFIFPFRRTPINIMSWALQHSPGLNLLSARWRADFAAGGARQSQAIARVVVGSAIAGIGYELAASGHLTGGGLFNTSAQNRTLRGAHSQPYSLKIGDTYYSIQRLEPAARILSLAADMHDLMTNAEDPEDKQNLAAMMVLMFGNATVSTTYMSGISNAMNAVTDPQRYGGNFVQQYAASLVPRIIGQTVQANDPYKREVDGVLEAIQAQLPYIREKLPPVRDVWGEKVKNQSLFNVLPIATNKAEKDTQQAKVKNEAARLAKVTLDPLGIGDAPKTVAERGPFAPSARAIQLTPQQKDVWRTVRGKQAMQWLMPIVNDPSWKGLADFQKVAIFRRVLQDAGRVATYKALPANAPAREQMRQQILQKIQQELQGEGQ